VSAKTLARANLLGGRTRELPPLTAKGRLPDGVHETSFAGLSRTFGFNAYRARMLRHLGATLLQAKRMGAHTVEIGGSFISSMERPGDIDIILRFSNRPPLASRVRLGFLASLRGQQLLPANERFWFPWRGPEQPAEQVGFLEVLRLARDGGSAGVVRIRLNEGGL